MNYRPKTLNLFGTTVVGIFALIMLCRLPPASAQVSRAVEAGQPATAASEPDAAAIDGIVECLNAGKEAVLLLLSVECMKNGDGSGYLKTNDPGMPSKMDAKICEESKEQAKDWRKLTSTAIKKIKAKLTLPYNPWGIRIIGAIFCDQLDLVGLDLPFSLVLDRSLFVDGLEARNFHTSGDLSLDDGAALGSVWVARSRIDGTIFGEHAYIKKLLILDSEIRGSLIFRGSTLPEPAIFDTIVLSGELSVREASLSYFFLQFSKIGGVLDLTGSQARCAYLLQKSEIGDLVAVDAGFGTSEHADEFYWRPDAAVIKRPYKRSAASDADKPATAGEPSECAFWKIASPGAFRVSDTHVRSSLCLRSFHWLRPGTDGRGASSIAFEDLKVDATSFIDLGSKGDGGVAAARASSAEKHNIHIVGLGTHSLVFNFGTQGQIDEMSLSALEFGQVYAAETHCEYDPKYYAGGDKRRPDDVLRLPRVNEVMGWLNSNCLETTQPFAAFVDAAQKSGNDTDARQFRIARADKELSLRISRAFGTGGASTCSADGGSQAADDQSVIGKSVTFLNDVLAIAFGEILRVIAQHGYRPEQAGFFVLATLVAAAAYFWLLTGIVGFVPAKKDPAGAIVPPQKQTVRPIGVTFLFDRLLPAYRIREEHYDIQAFYRWVRGKGADLSHAKEMKYFWLRVPVVEAEEKDTRRAERCLDIIKGIGLVLIIFLVAAVNALFSH